MGSLPRLLTLFPAIFLLVAGALALLTLERSLGISGEGTSRGLCSRRGVLRHRIPPGNVRDVRRKGAVEAAEGLREAGELVETAEERLIPLFRKIDRNTKKSLKRVLDAFRKHRVNPSLYQGGVDGYGHGDLGRETLDRIYADIFGADAAMVRVQMFSGTHAIAAALYGVLRPGDTLLAVSGPPYDTLEEVIGLRPPAEGAESYSGDQPHHWARDLSGTLKTFNVDYNSLDLAPDGKFDLNAIDDSLKADEEKRSIRVLHVQRSCGYSSRKSIPVEEIGRLCTHISSEYPHRHGKDLMIFVDNCYGEFVEELEPTHVGADLIAGSLIKNPGGTIAPSGGYIAGKAHFVEAALHRLSAPGVAGGAALGQNQRLYQGLFLAPTIVGESLKGAYLLAEVLGGELGLHCHPKPYSQDESPRTDIIQSVELGDPDRVLNFCRAVQRCSPIDSFVEPVPGVTPGYADPVVFADGTFVFGSTLELSADGPLREPYTVFAQGCTHFSHWSLVLEQALVDMALAK